MVKLSRGAFSENDVVQMEIKMLSLMNWYIHPPTTICFARQYLRFLFRYLEGQQKCDTMQDQQDLELPEQKMVVLPSFTRYLIIEITRFLSEISVCLSRFLKYPPSIIALACMLVAIEHVPSSSTTLITSKHDDDHHQQQQQQQHQETTTTTSTTAHSSATALLAHLHQRQEQCEHQHQQQQRRRQQLLPLWYRQYIFDFLAQIIIMDEKDENFNDNCKIHCNQLLEVLDDLQIYLESNEKSLQELIQTITKDCSNNSRRSNNTSTQQSHRNINSTLQQQ